MAEDNELDRIDPEPVIHKLTTGLAVEMVRLRTRQFFRLLRILTHGAGPAVVQAGLDFSAGAEQFATQLITLVAMSIPDAEQEAISFLQAMLKPAGLSEKAKPSKQEQADDEALWERFNTDLFNPVLEDTLDLLELIIKQEAPELQALGKKLQRMLQLFRATGQDKDQKEPEPSQQEMASPGSSLSRSTSSAASTAGPTTTSSASRSAGSGRSAKQPASASSPSG